ncbi:MAG TPA: CGNR zinc finger domain-containing protein [Nocardioides sp.]|nr:CGNR zinc finger domain-containing protein [Nocardioides sp.]
MSWWITVDDLVLPRQLAGHPALELVNSRSGWGEPFHERQEFLRSPDHLIVLARHTGVLDPDRAARLRRRARRERASAEAELDRARAVRRDLHDVVIGTATRTATARLAEAVGEARSRQRLVVEDDGGASWSLPAAPSLRDPVDAFLVAAGDLLVARPRVGACPGHDCGWLFVNASGRRRWCQMAVCGNRAKQASHLARSRA